MTDRRPRSFRHWTPRYLRDKAGALLYEFTHPNAPWLTPEANRRLQAALRPDAIGLEWGAGRSTSWFARRCARLVSVEHDPAWAEKIKKRLQQKGLIHKVELVLRPPEPEAFAAVADRFPPETLDFALVDGWAATRAQCALAAVSRLRPGGLLIVDDVNRYLLSTSRAPESLGPSAAMSGTWQQFADTVRAWPCEWTSNGVKDTAIWTKPVE